MHTANWLQRALDKNTLVSAPAAETVPTPKMLAKMGNILAQLSEMGCEVTGQVVSDGDGEMVTLLFTVNEPDDDSGALAHVVRLNFFDRYARIACEDSEVDFHVARGIGLQDWDGQRMSSFMVSWVLSGLKLCAEAYREYYHPAHVWEKDTRGATPDLLKAIARFRNAIPLSLHPLYRRQLERLAARMVIDLAAITETTLGDCNAELPF